MQLLFLNTDNFVPNIELTLLLILDKWLWQMGDQMETCPEKTVSYIDMYLPQIL